MGVFFTTSLALLVALLFLGSVTTIHKKPAYAAIAVPNMISHPKAFSSASQSSAVTEAVRTSFGSAVEVMTVFKPFHVTGDFNGDGGQDMVTVVRIKERRNSLAKDVTILNPWGALYGKATYPADPATKPTLALAIIHGTKAGWQTQAAGKFLLIGDSPILILNYDRTTSGPDALQGLISLIKLGKLRSGQSLPPTVKRARKGDVIVLGTEAVDSFLFWNGKTYLWEEEGED